MTLCAQSTRGHEYKTALGQRETRGTAEQRRCLPASSYSFGPIKVRGGRWAAGFVPGCRAFPRTQRESALLRAKRAINRAGDLLARAGSDRAPESNAPAFGTPGRALQPQVREYHGLINVNRDLFGAALGGDMLGACQRCPATVAGKPQEIFRDQRYRAPRAPLPRRVSRRIDDNLTHDSPTTMVRIAARNEEPGQRLGYAQQLRVRTRDRPGAAVRHPRPFRPRPPWRAPGQSAAALRRSTSISHRTRPERRPPLPTPTASVERPSRSVTRSRWLPGPQVQAA